MTTHPQGSTARYARNTLALAAALMLCGCALLDPGHGRPPPDPGDDYSPSATLPPGVNFNIDPAGGLTLLGNDGQPADLERLPLPIPLSGELESAQSFPILVIQGSKKILIPIDNTVLCACFSNDFSKYLGGCVNFQCP